MENDPNRNIDRDNKYYKKDDNAYSGWVIVGLIVFVIAVVALYQTRVRTTDDLSNIQPAAGSDSTVTNTMDNAVTPDNTMMPDTAPANTTTP